MLCDLHTRLWKNRQTLIIILSVASLLVFLVSIKDEKSAQKVIKFIVQKQQNLMQLINHNNTKDELRSDNAMDRPKVNNSKDIVGQQRCKIPMLNPFDPEILPFLKKPRMEKCKNHIYGVVEKDKLKLKVNNVVSVFLYYINRVDDFKNSFSRKIHLFGEDVPFCVEEPPSCWEACGHKGGPCPSMCGKNGYCCRKGYPGCPVSLEKIASRSSHTCQVSVPGSCWEACGNKGGPCPKICGKNGYCCRKSYPGCPVSLDKAASQSSHSCIMDVKTFEANGKDCDIVHQITQDHFKLVIIFPNKIHEEYHYCILDKSKEWGISQTPPDKQLNIMVIMMDSLSHSHAQRSLKNTYKYLSEHPRTVIMKGESIVGDGTTAQVTAMLTGIPEKDQPEARRGFKGASFVDGWKWLYHDLHKRNYVTVYSEEDSKGGLGTFWMRLHGFNKIPTLYYPRPLWRAMRDWIYNQKSSPHKYQYRYIRDLFDRNKNYNKFGTIFHQIMHNAVDTAENADDDTVTFLKEIQDSIHGNNTVVFLLGDHGLRTSALRGTLTGKLEERLPMLSITYPPKFEAFKAELKNLRTNSRLMTSHFDLYHTFQHISTFPRLNENVHSRKFGRSLFTDIGTLNRSCADAGVDIHWCACLNYEKVDPSKDRFVNQLTEKVISFINNRNEQTVPGKCQELKLKAVTTAGRRTPNTEVNQFKGTRTNKGGCDSCQVVLDKTKKFSRFVYEVVFTVSPNNSIANISLPVFEAGGEMRIGKSGVEIKIDPAISRINLYGNQPNCIATEYPHLKCCCFCKDFKEPV